jgi:hypothetical protein
LPAGTIDRVDSESGKLYVDLTKDQIKDSPSLTRAATTNPPIATGSAIITVATTAGSDHPCTMNQGPGRETAARPLVRWPGFSRSPAIRPTNHRCDTATNSRPTQLSQPSLWSFDYVLPGTLATAQAGLRTPNDAQRLESMGALHSRRPQTLGRILVALLLAGVTGLQRGRLPRTARVMSAMVSRSP